MQPAQTFRYYTPEGTLRWSGSKIVGVKRRTLQFFWSVECWSGSEKYKHSKVHSVIFQKIKCSAYKLIKILALDNRFWITALNI